jgi:flagellar protein FlbD
VIRLHKLARDPQAFQLNPDLILSIEAHPDTVVTLTTGSRLVVTETPDEVVQAIRQWRASVLDAMSRPARRGVNPLSLVRATAGDGAVAPLAAETAREESEIPHRGPHS